MIRCMSPGLLLVLLVAVLLALLPVWRLQRRRLASGRRWSTAWLVYALAIFLVVRVPGPARFLLPILVLAFVAPFVAGPERLARVLGRRDPAARPVIDVTPSPERRASRTRTPTRTRGPRHATEGSGVGPSARRARRVG